MTDPDPVRVEVEIADGDREDGGREVRARPGTVLRDALLDAGLTPHSDAGRRLNCGGRGLCATCGVRVLDPGDGDAAPDHWHDRLADRFGYPRLSCQLRVADGMRVRVPEKLVWGGRK